MKQASGQEKPALLLLGTQMAVGGAQRVLFDQARWFQEHGHQVTVAFYYDRDHLHAKWQQSVDFPIVDLRSFDPHAGRLSRVCLLFAGFFRLVRLLRRKRIDVIETFTPDSNLLGLPAAWLAGVPIRLASYHGLQENNPRWKQRLHAWLINSGIASLLVAVSDQVRRIALDEGVHADRIVTIPNGIRLPGSMDLPASAVRAALGIREDATFLLSVGRLTLQKAQDVLIQAMPELLAAHPQAVLCIAGGGPQHRSLQEQVSRLGLQEQVKLLGEREDVPALLAASDLFILPSRSEGLPIVLLEAMAAGRAVVASRAGGIADVIEDEKNGLLVPPDDPPALARSILRCIEDPHLRSRLGQAAGACVKASYTLERMCAEYLTLMEDPTRRPAPGGQR